MAKVAHAEWIVKCQDQLAEFHPDVLRCEFPAASPADSKSFEDLEQELKEMRSMYLSVEAQLRFIEGCQQSDLASLGSLVRGQALEKARITSKEWTRDLKGDITKEIEEHVQCYQELSDAYQNARKWHEQCTRELCEVSQLMDAAGEFGSQPLLTVGEWAGSLQDAVEDLDVGGERASKLFSEQSEELKKRRKVEHEKGCINQERRVMAAQHAELERLEASETAEVEHLERLEELGNQLGLPKIEFDDARSVVILGWPNADLHAVGDDVAIRTVAVKHAENGRLVRAEPHPSLGLWNEATTSVEDDDLGRLLTLVWDRVCELNDGFGGVGDSNSEN